MTDEEKRIRQKGYCKTYYQKNKERIKAKRQGNTAWLALEQAERDWKNTHKRLPTMKKELEAVRAKVIEAVPEIVVNPHAQLIGWDHKVTYFEECRPITIADVLRAIHKVEGIYATIDTKGQLNVSPFKGDTQWNLALPLDEQEPEVIEFLAKILL